MQICILSVTIQFMNIRLSTIFTKICLKMTYFNGISIGQDPDLNSINQSQYTKNTDFFIQQLFDKEKKLIFTGFKKEDESVKLGDWSRAERYASNMIEVRDSSLTYNISQSLLKTIPCFIFSSELLSFFFMSFFLEFTKWTKIILNSTL